MLQNNDPKILRYIRGDTACINRNTRKRWHPFIALFFVFPFHFPLFVVRDSALSVIRIFFFFSNQEENICMGNEMGWNSIDISSSKPIHARYSWNVYIKGVFKEIFSKRFWYNIVVLFPRYVKPISNRRPFRSTDVEPE